MPADLERGAWSIHATAVVIRQDAVLIRGPSGAGKSRLAWALVSASTRACPIGLLGDDRILLSMRAGHLTARPHPRVAGFIERRGLGIVAVPFQQVAPVFGCIELGAGTTPAKPAILQNFPVLSLVNERDVVRRRDAALSWWLAARGATCAQHPAAKTHAPMGAARKD